MTANNKQERDTRWDEAESVSDDPILPTKTSDLGRATKELAEDISRNRKLCEDRVEVNQIIDRPAEIRREKDITVVPVMKEKLVLVKKLVVVEEIRLRTVPPEEEC